MLTPLSRTLHPDNYLYLLDETARIFHARNIFAGHYQFDHHHRTWEYSLCLASLGPRDNVPGKRILDVGGGYSVLGGILAWNGAQVIVNDVSPHDSRQGQMKRLALESPWALGGCLTFSQADFTQGTTEQFDAVFCVSVIEHTADDDKFFTSIKRAVKPGGVLLLTTDFHPSGQPQTNGHVRTYNREKLEAWGTSDPNFVSEGGFDYHDRGNWVTLSPTCHYNFASLCLRRIG